MKCDGRATGIRLAFGVVLAFSSANRFGRVAQRKLHQEEGEFQQQKMMEGRFGVAVGPLMLVLRAHRSYF